MIATRRRQRGFIIDPFRFGAGGGGDPYLGSVTLLCHATSLVGSDIPAVIKPTTDPSVQGASNQPTLSVSEFQFGGASIEFPSSVFTAYVGIANAGGGFTLGAGDWTVEGWFYIRDSRVQVLWDFRFPSESSNAYCYVSNTSQQISFGNGISGDLIVSGNGAFSNNTWIHVMVTRASGTYRLFIDGTQFGGDQTDANPYSGAPTALIWGSSFLFTSSLNGYTQEWRVTKGVARETSNFTRPAAPFSDT